MLSRLRRIIVGQGVGAPEFLALRAKGDADPIEKFGRELRKADNESDYAEGSAGR